MNPLRTRNWQENDVEAQQPLKAHRCPRDVLEMSYGGPETSKELGI